MFLGVVGSGVQASLRRYDDGSTSNETNPWRNVIYPCQLIPYLTSCALSKANTEHRTIDTVDETIGQIQEQMDLATEISTVIGTPLGDAFDEVIFAEGQIGNAVNLV